MADETKPLILYSRSSVATDWNCPRQRYWRYEYGGTGITLGTSTIQLSMGTTLHDAFAMLAQTYADGNQIDARELAELAGKQMFDALYEEGMPEEAKDYALEQSYLVRGIVYGFTVFRWPQLTAQYPNVLKIESPIVYPQGDSVGFMAKPDLVLGNDEGEVVYVEYKSTSSKKSEWIDSWNTAVQLHSTCAAIKYAFDLDVTNVIIQGLYKGYYAYGKQSSPFCYAYYRQGNPPFSKDEYSYNYRAGLKKFPVWQLPVDFYTWVDNMPEDIWNEQFPQTPPIFPNEDLVTRFFAQCKHRELEVAAARESLSALSDEDPEQLVEILDKVFPQKFEQCRPAWGSECEYRRLCHGPAVDPIQMGYTQRDVSHRSEFTEISSENAEE